MFEKHEEQTLRIRSQAMIPLARLVHNDTIMKEILTYSVDYNRTTEINGWTAMGLLPDTLAVVNLIKGIFGKSGNYYPAILAGLHSLWQIAQKDTVFMNKLEKSKLIMAYRHMLIRFSSFNDDPSVTAITMDELRDPLIITTDSIKKEAEEYLSHYLEIYGDSKHNDELVSVLGAIAWLKPKNDTFKVKIKAIYDQAISTWGNQMVADTARLALEALGVPQQYEKAKVIRAPIDWQTIEQLPDTMLISTEYGLLFLKLNTYETPLTVLNMYKLAKRSFLLNNFIHRVVPNFVIQTGDITGAGYGGPGYSIRTEISPLRYDSAGVVGMASSGKDTEGSQWFITHCPTPHLNTNYTVWGEIVKGNEYIEKYQLNEVIMNVIPYK
jgi:cyclophilin family peptidyl-prolyl cis-trans isomerase